MFFCSIQAALTPIDAEFIAGLAALVWDSAPVFLKRSLRPSARDLRVSAAEVRGVQLEVLPKHGLAAEAGRLKGHLRPLEDPKQRQFLQVPVRLTSSWGQQLVPRYCLFKQFVLR